MNFCEFWVVDLEVLREGCVRICIFICEYLAANCGHLVLFLKIVVDVCNCGYLAYLTCG